MKFGKQTGRENENKRQLDEWLWSVLKAGGEGALFPLYPYSMQSGCQGRLKRGWLGHSTATIASSSWRALFVSFRDHSPPPQTVSHNNNMWGRTIVNGDDANSPSLNTEH